VARLAEAATLGAAAHDLHGEAVVHELNVGDEVVDRVVGGVEFFDPVARHAFGAEVGALGAFHHGDDFAALVGGDVKQGGHVDAAPRGHLAQDFGARLARTAAFGEVP